MFPQTLTQMRSFIGMINFYCDFYRMRAHMMEPLSALTGKNNSACGKIACTPRLLQAFNRVKSAVAEQVLLIFLDPNKILDIYTDASDDQLGAVITQLGKVLAFLFQEINCVP